MSQLEKHQTLLNLIKTQDRLSVPVLPYTYAYQALDILKKQSSIQLYLVCAAANYLNAFVKQVESTEFKDAYYFKALLIERLNHIEDLEDHCYLEGDTLLIETEGLQFSFHHVDLKALKKASRLKMKPWSKLKLQSYALEIFKDALSVYQPNQDIPT